LNGAFLCAREFKLKRAGLAGGSMVNVICDMQLGFPGMAHTGAARAGVENLTKTLALEWAADGVRCNAVAPGIVYSASAAANYPTPDFLTRLKGKVPAKRLGTQAEVSAAVCFLLSDHAASYVTGTTLHVDGGCPLNGPIFWEVPEHSNWPSPPPLAQAKLDKQLL
jgi:peroxisomal trans-2-enoyl-CoA reductase